jgi:hypothetical protein
MDRIMFWLARIVLALSLAHTASADGFNPFEGPRPIAILIQTDPWDAVIGSDTPRVAIYEDGEVVYAKAASHELAYYHVALDKHELHKIQEHLRPVLALKDLKPSYDIARGVTDQPEAMFYLRDAEREVATTVYGLTLKGTKLPAYAEFHSDQGAVVPPNELLKLHQWLSELDFPNRKEWSPKYVEVMLWDYSYAPEASIHWPKDWPSLSSERAVKRGEDYSIFLNGALLPKLRDFLASRNERGAVELAGKKWAAAYRCTFPSEPVWRKAFAAAADTARHENGGD